MIIQNLPWYTKNNIFGNPLPGHLQDNTVVRNIYSDDNHHLITVADSTPFQNRAGFLSFT